MTETEEIWIEGERYYLAKAYCCREWSVILGVRIGRCGYCGERPVIR